MRAGGATAAVGLTAGFITLAALTALVVALGAEAGTERSAVGRSAVEPSR